MPNLNMNQPFECFTGVEALAPGHPVFLIADADDDSCLVIKRDNTARGGEDSLRHNLVMMKDVSPGASAKPLVKGEMDAVRDFLTNEQWRAKLLKIPESSDTSSLRQSFDAYPDGWFKMDRAAQVQDLKAAVKALVEKSDKTGVRAIAKALNATGGLEAVGKIVAADLYNGNNDRFAFDGGGGDVNVLAGDGSRFRCLCNLGNVMISMQESKLKPIGLDSWDPSNTFSDIAITIEAVEQANELVKWSGRKLASGEKVWRKQFAADICQDLEAALGERKRKYSFLRKSRLPADATKRLYDGIKQGTMAIKKRLTTMIEAGNKAAGLPSRLAILNS